MRGALICGLPGAGKTTLAARLVSALEARGIRAAHVDGDAMRQVWRAADTDAGRLERCRENALFCDHLARRGYFPVCSIVAPSLAARDAFRALGFAALILRTCYATRPPEYMPTLFDLPTFGEATAYSEREAEDWLASTVDRAATSFLGYIPHNRRPPNDARKMD